MTEAELKIVQEIARHQVDPNPVQRVMATLGTPFEKAIQAAEKIPLVKRLPALAHRGVDKALRASILAGGYTFSDEGVLKEYAKLHGLSGPEQIAGSPLELRDRVADRFRVSNALLIGAEGALLGFGASVCEGFPGAQLLLPAVVAADIAASMTLLSRHASQVAASYGFSPKVPANLPHVIASMVPYSDLKPGGPASPSEEDGFFAAKSGVIAEVRAASRFLSASAGPDLLSRGKAPLLIRLIQTVATRLEVSVTQKELAMLVPLAGAGLNGAVNVAFQQAGHLCSKDYFRRIVLAEKYGDDAVRLAIVKAIDEYRASR
jgi:hypothetical protein